MGVRAMGVRAMRARASEQDGDRRADGGCDGGDLPTALGSSLVCQK